MRTNYYEPRYISNEINASSKTSFFEEEKGITLSELLKENSKIVLLGNPGIGKTTELKNTFEELWESKSESGNIPFYINIKNFRKNSNFDELIPYDDWKKLSFITFILDGLDEIAEIQDFISELENFLKKNKEINIKILLSCRTNIYEKFMVVIPGFKYCYLENLNDVQIFNILKKQYNIELSNLELNGYKIYLENPFNLTLFAQFYLENNRFPETQLENWDLFIQTELKKLNRDKLIKRQNIDISHISLCLEKVAFVNELMQQNFIEDSDLLNLVGKDDKAIFEQITFIERLPNANKLIFRHKNYQEFFAAKYLSKLESDKIISILQIHPTVNKTKPALFNTITFLLNILDQKKYHSLKNWLFDHELEILFHSEIERLNEKTRNEIFEKYFMENSIKKTFWIGRSEKFSISTVSKFANLDFLTTFIIANKNNNQFRSIKSAIEVLSYAKIPHDRKNDIKQYFEELLFSNEHEFKEDLLRAIRLQGFHKNENSFFLKIGNYFKNENSGEINHQIIVMVNDYEDVDINFEILKNSLYKMYKKTPERLKDNTIRGTHWILEQLIFKIKKPKNFIQVLNVIFNDGFSLKLSDFYDKNFKDNLIERITIFINNDISFLFKIIDAFLKPENNYIYRIDQFLPELIKFSQMELESFKYILENYGLTIKTIQLIGLISSEHTVNYFVDCYQKNTFELNEINRLKWNIFNNNKELGYYFEKKMINSGFEFTEKIPEEKEIEKRKTDYETFIKLNFDILFNKKELLIKIKEVFDENKKEVISFADYHEINMKWYEKTNYHSLTYTVHETISKAIRDYNNQTFESISDILKDNYFILSLIKDKLKGNNNEKYNITEEKVNFIKSECYKILKDFNYNEIIKFSDETGDNYSVYPNYFKLKTLYYFDAKFGFNYSNDFYLKTLKYCNIIDNSDQNEIFNIIKERINDKNTFDIQVIKNVTEEKLNYFSLKDHINYSIEQKLYKTYKKIGQYILNDKYLFSQNNLLTDFSNLLDNQKVFLKSCCSDVNSYLCWNAISILKSKKLDDNFIIDISHKYIKLNETSFLQQALNILFYGNEINALKIYVDCLKNDHKNKSRDRMEGFIIEDLKNFKHIEELDVIEKFFNIVYDEKNTDTFDHHYSKQMLVAIVNNFSSCIQGYEKLTKILNKIKEELNNNYSKKFYINHLIDQSENSYYNSLSKNLSFQDSINIIENI